MTTAILTIAELTTRVVTVHRGDAATAEKMWVAIPDHGGADHLLGPCRELSRHDAESLANDRGLIVSDCDWCGGTGTVCDALGDFPTPCSCMEVER